MAKVCIQKMLLFNFLGLIDWFVLALDFYIWMWVEILFQIDAARLNSEMPTTFACWSRFFREVLNWRLCSLRWFLDDNFGLHTFKLQRFKINLFWFLNFDESAVFSFIFAQTIIFYVFEIWCQQILAFSYVYWLLAWIVKHHALFRLVEKWRKLILHIKFCNLFLS